LGQFTAFLDASVLYPAPLRDLLLELAVADLYRAKWSDAVHEEWIRSVLRDRPDLTRAQLERTCDLMNLHARDALVSDFEDLIDVLKLPDPDDCHVLAGTGRCHRHEQSPGLPCRSARKMGNRSAAPG